MFAWSRAGLFYAWCISMKLYYGLESAVQIKAIAKKVVDVLGGSNAVYCLMVETTAAETLMGTYPDSHEDHSGVGVCQHDQINIDDIQENGEQRHFDLIKEHFGYDMHSIVLSDLAYDPLLSLICCRLSYKRIPASVPDDLKGRAEYWKEYYNTAAGAGTEEEYMTRVAECLGDEWL
jgi:hypothetical protein